jgi:amino acid adenylation domain-containing protein
LPTDRPRPAVQSFRGKNIEVVLDARLSTALKAFSQRYEMTLFMVLYAGWAILLSRLSGQEDVVIGTPIANRQRPELEGLIGFFVNTLVLRLRVRRDMRLEEVLEALKAVTLGAYDHQDVPFEQVVEALQPQRSLSRNPLFQVSFALQNAPKSELQLPGLTAILEDGMDEPAMFDLFLSLEERGDKIVGSVNYATDLFDRETVERWMACFTVLMRGMIDDMQSCIGDLPILPDDERRQVIDLFNATQVKYPQDNLIHELFEEEVRRAPNAIAVAYEHQSLTYAELNGRANQLARYLRDKGVGPDQLVGVCVERSVEMVVALLGILKAGGAYLPLDPNYPAKRLQYMLEDATPRVLLIQEACRALLLSAKAEVIALDTDVKWTEEYLGENLSTAKLGLTAQNLVYVIYTSGSTGHPKGTAMPHRSMVNLIEWHRKTFRIGEGQRVLQFAALSFDVAFQETFSTLCTGGTLVLLDEWIRKDARALLEFLSSRSIDRLFVPPLMLQSLAECLKTTSAMPGRLQDVIVAGEQLRISPEISEFFKKLNGCRLHNHYGPTETHVVTALTLTGDPGEWPALPAIGQPISNTQIYVLDGLRQPVPICVAGEICIGGTGMARGYLRQPKLTGQRFIPNPFSADPQLRLYKTGDVGRWRADGTLEYLGRNDHQVKIRGYRVELGEIETHLARHEQLKEAIVVAREDALGENRLVAYVIPSDRTGAGAVPNVDALRAHMTAVLPEYMVPSAFVTLESFPLTPNGKLDRHSLPSPALGAYLSQEYEAPQGEIEEALARIWQELLRVDRVGRQDNFFELGGHSLLATRVMTHISHLLEVDLPLRVIFEKPTIQALSNCVVKEIAAEVSMETP